MDNQTQKKPVTAARRGITGAIAGEAVMIVIFILVAASGAQVSFAYALIYLLFGPNYGFGFTFANWRLVAEKTKRGAIEGGAVLGIGIIHVLPDGKRKMGLLGMDLFCVPRILAYWNVLDSRRMVWNSGDPSGEKGA